LSAHLYLRGRKFGLAEAGDMTKSFQILAVQPYYGDGHTKEEVEKGKKVVEICGMGCRAETFKLWSESLEKKRPLGRPTRRWKDTIAMILNNVWVEHI
jgi:hypothetical protein